MWPGLTNVAGIQVTIFGVVLALTFIGLSFYLWRNMREDYAEDGIITLTILLSVVALVASRGWKWWSVGGELAACIVTLVAWCKYKGWDAWEWLDSLTPAFLAAGALACLAWGPGGLAAAGVLGLGLVLCFLAKRNYRSLRWYKSGRMGFVGLVGIEWFLVSWILIANWQVSQVYWGGLSLENWVAIWATLATVITLYLRGGRRITQDWRKISRLWQLNPNKH